MGDADQSNAKAQSGFQRADVYTIPPHAPFLKTLAAAILDGTLLPNQWGVHGEGMFDRTDPLALSDVTLYLPTRRAVQAMQAAFHDVNQGKAVLILPQLRALGESDEDDHFFDPELPNFPLAPDLSPAVQPLKRMMVLSRLILAWGKTRDAHLKNAGRDEPLLVPASPADAMWLAKDLAGLMDRAITEEINWRDLQNIGVEDHAEFWQMTLEFLKIATEHWPQYLAASNEVDQATRRDKEMAAEIERLTNHIGNKPVIVAGSTGTLPSTAKFIAAVSRLPNGCAVLPGLDLGLPEDVWQLIGGPDELEKAETSHPQYGLKRLLETFIKEHRGIVETLGEGDEIRALRSRAVSEAMRPAVRTDSWPVFRTEVASENLSNAFAGVSIIEAVSDKQEAQAIACLLREHVETSVEPAFLVTPDRTLARRVALDLKRWGIDVDDSAGRPLAKTAPAILAQLVAKTVLSDLEPVSLLALLKHPLTSLGLSRSDVRRAARVLDMAILRGPRLPGGVPALRRRLALISASVQSGATNRPSELDENEVTNRQIRHVHPTIRAFNDEDWTLAETVLNALEEAFTPLNQLIEQDGISFSDWLAAHDQSMRLVVGDESLDQDQAYRAVQKIFAGAAFPEAKNYAVAAAEYADLFRAMLGTGTIRGQLPNDPRIVILGALEARLLSPHLLILAGLDEGTWPKEARSDAFLSRSMAMEIQLEPPERRIGLAAHDIQQGLGAERVVLTRAVKRSDTPVVASRWLQRLLALLGDDISKELKERGDKYLAISRNLSASQTPYVQPASMPNPKPPLEARPTQLSVTRIETLVRDPYAIYGQYVLRLRDIDPLGDMPDYSERGTIVHKALERFARVWTDWNAISSPAALQQLLQIGRELFDEEIADFPEIRALWWPRFERMAKSYLSWEAGREEDVRSRHSEIRGEINIPIEGPTESPTESMSFRLTAEADRLEEWADGSVAIFDFKTGELPTASQVKAGFSAQLGLEAALFKKGGFGAAAPDGGARLSALGWLKVDGLAEVAVHRSAVSDKDTAEEIAELSEEKLVELIRNYQNPEQGYVPRARPQRIRHASPYDHLSRFAEWSRADEEASS